MKEETRRRRLLEHRSSTTRTTGSIEEGGILGISTRWRTIGVRLTHRKRNRPSINSLKRSKSWTVELNRQIYRHNYLGIIHRGISGTTLWPPWICKELRRTHMAATWAFPLHSNRSIYQSNTLWMTSSSAPSLIWLTTTRLKSGIRTFLRGNLGLSTRISWPLKIATSRQARKITNMRTICPETTHPPTSLTPL